VDVAGGSYREVALPDTGHSPHLERPEEFAAYVRSEIQKWGKVIKDANIKVE
jgi:tripartite-type tricarboxylate transporter receptor subunit TctC